MWDLLLEPKNQQVLPGRIIYHFKFMTYPRETTPINHEYSNLVYDVYEYGKWWKVESRMRVEPFIYSVCSLELHSEFERWLV